MTNEHAVLHTGCTDQYSGVLAPVLSHGSSYQSLTYSCVLERMTCAQDFTPNKRHHGNLDRKSSADLLSNILFRLGTSKPRQFRRGLCSSLKHYAPQPCLTMLCF
jgi:hypothetical protein